MTLPRLYPILDTGVLERRRCGLVEAAEAMLEGGAGILQLRHKGHFTRALFDDAERVATSCRGIGTIFVVNDRADMARLLEAGAHIGQDDLPPREARSVLGEGAPLGFSTHNAAQLEAAAAEPADYLALGPIFATGSKENPDPVVGVERLRSWRTLTTRPLVAIGGIGLANAREVLDAGADSVAVIGDLLAEPCTRQTLRQRVEQWLQLLTP